MILIMLILRRNRRNKNQIGFFNTILIDQIQRQFGFVMPVKFYSISIDAELSSDLCDGFKGCLFGNFDIGSHRGINQMRLVMEGELASIQYFLTTGHKKGNGSLAVG